MEPKRRMEINRAKEAYFWHLYVGPSSLSFENDSTRKLDSRQQVSDGEIKRPSLSMRASVRFLSSKFINARYLARKKNIYSRDEQKKTREMDTWRIKILKEN